MTTLEEPLTTVSARVPVTLLADLHRLARQERRAVSNLVRVLLEDYVQHLEDFAASRGPDDRADPV